MLIGYARVSTMNQDNQLQIDALHRAQVNPENIYQEKRSAASKRPILQAMLSKLQPGDVVVVYKLDRFARSLIDLLGIIAKIEGAGATFRSLTESIDTSTPAGRMLMQMLGAFAEFERGIIRERSMAGQRAARERGIMPGRRRVLTPAQESELVALYLTGGHTHHGLSIRFACSLSAVKRAVYRVTKPGSSSLK